MREIEENNNSSCEGGLTEHKDAKGSADPSPQYSDDPNKRVWEERIVELVAEANTGANSRGPRRLFGWWKLLTTIALVAVLFVALALTGVLVPGKGADEGLPHAGPVDATPDSDGTSYTLGSLVPTNKWVNFYSLQSTLDGQPLPVGTVVTAHDPQGVVCGEFLVTQAGRYGLMPIYGDDPLTEVDEGAIPGDPFEFRINGIPATATGPDEPIWTAMGDLKQVNLAGSTTP